MLLTCWARRICVIMIYVFLWSSGTKRRLDGVHYHMLCKEGMHICLEGSQSLKKVISRC
jgi:hypothetical protein